ncbi:MAG: peptide-methionine (S)-S-oxide reductase MsrA, partial [Bdellovibrionales bacterium]
MGVVIKSLLISVLLFAAAVAQAAVPPPTADAPLAEESGSESIILAGGCFWGLQAVFKHVKGVTKTVAGYAGGDAGTAQYDKVNTGMTGHAEAVKVTYDPSKITPGQLLRVFFAVSHDPTQLNRQGPDVGTQYRSAILFATPQQEEIANAYIAHLGARLVCPKPCVTKVEA